MKRNNNIQKHLFVSLLMLIVLAVGIGYAVLSEQLTISNTISYDSMKWNVGFSAAIDGGGTINSNPTILSDKKTIVVTCDVGISTSSETCISKATIKNDSTFNVSLSSSPTITYNDTYINNVTLEWISNSSTVTESDMLENNESKDIRITITTKELTEEMLPSQSMSVPITISLNFEESEVIEILSGKGKAIGDEVRIKNERFYVLSNDGTNVTLLSKYNLEVGNYCKGTTCSAIENPSGLQSDMTTGLKTTGKYGVVPFSSSSYWYSGSLLAKYGSTFPAYVYDENASVKTYMDNYENYIESLGVTVTSARVIKQEELIELGCSGKTCKNSSYNWLYTTNYWTGTSNRSYYLYYVGSTGSFDYDTYSVEYIAGVRPVIVIPSSEI